MNVVIVFINTTKIITKKNHWTVLNATSNKDEGMKEFNLEKKSF